MAPFIAKLRQNAFQMIPIISCFDAENQWLAILLFLKYFFGIEVALRPMPPTCRENLLGPELDQTRLPKIDEKSDLWKPSDSTQEALHSCLTHWLGCFD